MRITRREFIKYCAAAAGALGLTTTDLLKLEKAMATSVDDGGTQVVWLNGAACTGCTVSLANTANMASIQDLLVPWAKAASYVAASAYPTAITTSALLGAIGNGVLTDTAANGPLDLVFMETLSSAVGYRAVEAAETVLSGTAPFVLCVEGSIQTGSSGNFCRIGSGASASDTSTKSFADEVYTYASSDNCLAVLGVGTCASFGGIPAAKGSVTDARGLISTGKISGGYKTTNTTGFWDYLKTNPDGTLASIQLTSTGSADYTSAPTVTISGGGGSGASATVTIDTSTLTSFHHITGITLSSAGSGYTSVPTVTLSGGGAGTQATAVVTLSTGLDNETWTALMRKTVCVSGCPPHPDWIVGTIVYLLTYGEPPLTDKWHRPTDFYGNYQCDNCLWQTNIPGHSNVNSGDNPMKLMDGTPLSDTTKGGVSKGNSPKLYKYKYDSVYEGCLGVMGCKGRKTKADCSFRRWNADTLDSTGISWCVQTRAGCHGCTDPRFPDGWGKFFAFK
jgi:Ni,Fe-hydrogenase I small subunit